ncbi:hypothetical protein HDV06_003927 [Boothiomyces sp. JEL0866]|nr:hypothetical protein HDV06_003927 [Boothiomyces sp. JEL0866]
MSNLQHSPAKYYHNNSSPSSLNILLPEHGNDNSIQETLIGKQLNYPMGSFNPHSYMPQNSYMGQDEDTVLSRVKDNINHPKDVSPPAQHAAAAAQGDQDIANRGKLVLPKLNLNVNDSGASFPDDSLSPNEFPLSTSTVSSSATPMMADSPNSKPKRERPRSHTPRPSNSFILYRREKHIEIMAQYKGVKTLNNNVISKIVANMWRSESPEVKAHFSALADAEKRAHMLKYPDYKYRPRKSVIKKSPTRKTPTTSSKELKMPAMSQPMGMVQQAYPPNMAAPYSSMGQQMHWNVMPQHINPMSQGHYQQMHLMDQAHQIPMMESEVEHGYDMMGGERFVMSPNFDGHENFLPHDTMLSPAEYTHSWPMGASIHGVWDLGLDQKPLGELSE